MKNLLTQPSVRYSLLNSRFFEEEAVPTPFREEETEYRALFHIPGLKKEAVQVTEHEGFLSVVAKSPEDAVVTIDYNKTFELPEDADAEALVAKLEDGILTVTVAKYEVVEVPERVIAIG